MITQPTQSGSLPARSLIQRRRAKLDRRTHRSVRPIVVSLRRSFLVGIFGAISFAGLTHPALGHEDQVIEYGSFLAGFTHPVLGLDHFIAMVSVGIISALIGGRAIWIVPTAFVVMMAVGGVAGYADIGLSSTAVEFGIAISVILLGGVMAAGQAIDLRIALVFVAFFGFFHGYAHGQEIPDIADAGVYALGFITGTILIHLLGVLIGEVAIRYPYGRPALRVAGVVFMVIGVLFIFGVL